MGTNQRGTDRHDRRRDRRTSSSSSRTATMATIGPTADRTWSPCGTPCSTARSGSRPRPSRRRRSTCAATRRITVLIEDGVTYDTLRGVSIDGHGRDRRRRPGSAAARRRQRVGALHRPLHRRDAAVRRADDEQADRRARRCRPHARLGSPQAGHGPRCPSGVRPRSTCDTPARALSTQPAAADFRNGADRVPATWSRGNTRTFRGEPAPNPVHCSSGQPPPWPWCSAWSPPARHRRRAPRATSPVHPAARQLRRAAVHRRVTRPAPALRRAHPAARQRHRRRHRELLPARGLRADRRDQRCRPADPASDRLRRVRRRAHLRPHAGRPRVRRRLGDRARPSLLLQLGRGPARVAVADVPGIDAFSLVTSGQTFVPSADAEALVTEQVGAHQDLRRRRAGEIVADAQAEADGINA